MIEKSQNFQLTFFSEGYSIKVCLAEFQQDMNSIIDTQRGREGDRYA